MGQLTIKKKKKNEQRIETEKIKWRKKHGISSYDYDTKHEIEFENENEMCNIRTVESELSCLSFIGFVVVPCT